jgi:hypothetical protein
MPRTYASYYRAIGKVFNARLQPFRELLSAEGRVRQEIGIRAELLLVRFLNDYLPRRWAAGTGLIIGLEEAQGEGVPAEQSNQIDVLVYDAFDFPVLFRDGEFVAVTPESIAAHIHVRTTLTTTLLSGAVEQVQKVKWLSRLNEQVRGYVVGFTTPTQAQLLPRLKELDEATPDTEWVDGVCVLDSDYYIGPYPRRSVYSEGGCEAFLQEIMRTLDLVQQQSAESPDDRTLHSQNQSEEEKNTNESSK